ncbi:MAG TPA: class I SAM-dependent methyltransferase [Paludibacteraceae bacterium]|nr:class I SAM-dependent methyltransferase [Paludibacteraceae bacterium]
MYNEPLNNISIQTKTKSNYFHSSRPEMLKYIPEKAQKILEIGCGEGAFCADLMRADREIWGVEMNPDAAEKAKRFCQQMLVGDFMEVYSQLPEHYFDCIIFNDVLEHLYNPWKVVDLVKNLLSEQGVLVTSIPNFRYISNLITEILFHKDFQYKPEGGILDDTHIRFFTSKSILRMFEENGYEILVHEGIRPCKSWKEKLFIALSFGLLKDARYKQFATVVREK